MLKPLAALALLSLSAPAFAGECEANFSKSGNPIVMTTYSSAVTVPNLATRDALAQMRGILVAEKMDVMAEDIEGGTLLVEQRQSKSARPIPTTITVSDVQSGTRIEMAVKMERGVFSRVEQIPTCAACSPRSRAATKAWPPHVRARARPTTRRPPTRTYSCSRA